MGSLPEPGPAGAGGVSPRATLSGAVADPMIVTPDTGCAEPVHNGNGNHRGGRTPTTDTYTGVSLWTLIQDAGLLNHPTGRTTCWDLRWWQPEATGTGRWPRWGKSHPTFGNQPDLVGTPTLETSSDPAAATAPRASSCRAITPAGATRPTSSVF